MTSLLVLPTLTPFFIIGSIVEILIAGFVFKMALRAVGGQITLSRAMIFSIIIKSINIITSVFIPSIFYGLYILTLNTALWLLLIMKVYKLSFARAIIIAIIQLIITFVFTIIGIPTFIQFLKIGVII